MPRVRRAYANGTGLTDAMRTVQVPDFRSYKLYAAAQPQNVQRLYLQLESSDHAIRQPTTKETNDGQARRALRNPSDHSRLRRVLCGHPCAARGHAARPHALRGECGAGRGRGRASRRITSWRSCISSRWTRSRPRSPPRGPRRQPTIWRTSRRRASNSSCSTTKDVCARDRRRRAAAVREAPAGRERPAAGRFANGENDMARKDAQRTDRSRRPAIRTFPVRSSSCFRAAARSAPIERACIRRCTTRASSRTG